MEQYWVLVNNEHFVSSLVRMTTWKVRSRCCICLLMAAAIILLVVAQRARTKSVLNATDTMSATAGKMHIAHLQKHLVSICVCDVMLPNR